MNSFLGRLQPLPGAMAQAAVSLTAKLIEEIEARVWKQVITENITAILGSGTVTANQGNYKTFLKAKLLRFEPPEEVSLVAGKNEIATPKETFLQWKMTGGEAEITAILGEVEVGELLIVNIRITATGKVKLVHREAGVSEANRLNLPEGLPITLENPSVLPHVLTFVKTIAGWQLVARTG